MSSVHDSVVEVIAGWIVGGRCPPGSILPTEPVICSELGASRTAVREAVKTLAAKGLVESRRRSGTRVRTEDEWNLFDPRVVEWRLAAPPTPDLVDDLVELRLLIEPPAAALAAERAGPGALEALAHALARMERACGGEGSFIDADLAFHDAILRATGNQFLVRLAPVIGAVLRLSFELSVTSLASARASLPAHAALLAAIRARDAAGARAALTAIIIDARADLARVLATRAAAASAPGKPEA